MQSVAVSPDGTKIVTGSMDKTARIYNADGSGVPIVLRQHDSFIDSVAFREDGKRIVTGSEDHTARIWNVDGTGAKILLKDHASAISSLAFHPDGKKLIVGCDDRPPIILNADGSDAPLLFKGRQDLVHRVAFTPDGKQVLQRVVRDLDDEARCLWIDEGKTANARRRLEVPEVIQPYLSRLAEGKCPADYLFGASKNGRARANQKMWEMVRRLCERAGVPPVCTHSLRGLWATLAVQSGAASHVVAANLGHHSFSVTERHYAQGSAVANAATARVLGTLSSERLGERKSAREQLDQLDEGTLARLIELLADSKRGGAPPN